jgi:hypothetical protein
LINLGNTRSTRIARASRTLVASSLSHKPMDDETKGRVQPIRAFLHLPDAVAKSDRIGSLTLENFMFSRNCRPGALAACGLVLLALASTSSATSDSTLHGQWKGQTHLDGEKGTVATSLSIAGGAGHLRIDGTSHCSIDGALEPSTDATCWRLKASDSHGTSMCDALSKGELTLCTGDGNIVRLEARYSKDGHDLKRLGTLGHYP